MCYENILKLLFPSVVMENTEKASERKWHVDQVNGWVKF